MLEVDIEELVQLKEHGKTYEEISELYKQKGIQISAITIGKKLRPYYETQGKKVPRSKASDIDKVTVEEIIKLKIIGKTVKQISAYYKRKGMNISPQDISEKIEEHELEKAKEKRESIDRELKYIILNGESIKGYCERKKCPEREEEFKERIRRLKVIASKANKQGETYVEDGNFLKVLTILESSMISPQADKYSLYINPYIENGICKNGKIDLICISVFNSNKDLMCYILSALKLKYGEGYDNKAWERFRKDHEAKIDRYIERLHSIEEKRRNTIRKKSKNGIGYQDDDDQR